MEPFRFHELLTIPVNQGGGDVEFTVPNNKLLHIEFISGDMELSASQDSFVTVSIAIFDAAGTRTGVYCAIAQKLGNKGTSDVFEWGQLVSVYADPGTKVGVRVNRFGAPVHDQIGVLMSISGQLFTV